MRENRLHGLEGVETKSSLPLFDFSGQHCNFTDLEFFQLAVGKNGRCVLYREEMVAPVVKVPYCLVEQWQTQCIYTDMASYHHVAFSRRATCISKANLAPSGTMVPGFESPSNQDGDSNPKYYLPCPAYHPAPGLH